MPVPIIAFTAITGLYHQYLVSAMLLQEVCLLSIHIPIISISYFPLDPKGFVDAELLYALSLG